MTSSGRETEVKFLVRHLEALAGRVEALGAVLAIPRAHEWNSRFDTPGKALAKTGRVLRLRRDDSIRLTFKGPSQNRDGALTRDEFETTVGNMQSTRQILEALGFTVAFEYEKYRATYQYEGTEIMLDELPCGCFVEIEGEAARLRPLAERLQLRWENAITESYQALFERLREHAHLPFQDLTFANFKNAAVDLRVLGLHPADA